MGTGSDIEHLASETLASETLASRHRKVAVILGVFAVAMLGAAYAAVPLYRIFCQVTGFAGTTQRAQSGADKVLARTIVVRFDANTGPGINWKFTPLQTKIELRIGETALAFYKAVNLSDRPVTGSATFNVSPEVAGAYFNKIACFCFTEQTLQPGESVDMPVSFFIDPDIVTDPDATVLSEITLSYTFYPVTRKKPAARRKGS